MRRLDRGAAWSVVGNLLNILPSILEIILLRKFGLGIWGEFLAAQAIVLLTGRIACMGFDKGLLWFLPNLRKSTHGLRVPVLVAATEVFLLGVVFTWIVAGWLMGLLLPQATELSLVQWTILATPFFAASEVLIGGLQGIHRFQYRPLLRDLGTSAFLAPVALTLAVYLQFGPESLGIGFLVGHVVIMVLALVFWLKETRDLKGGELAPSMVLARYSFPLWIGDSLSSVNQRITILVLSRVATSQVVGAFGVINLVWHTCMLVRRSFETPLVAVTAGAHSHEVRDLYLRVVVKVIKWQIPIVLVIAFAGGDILHLISPALGSWDQHLGLALLVATSFTATTPWMAQQILAGLGHSTKLLWSSTTGTLAGTLLVWFLTPKFGIIGACLGQAAAVIISGLIGAWQILRHVNLPGYPSITFVPIGATLVGGAIGLGVWRFADASPVWAPNWPAWILGSLLVLAWVFVVKPWRAIRA